MSTKRSDRQYARKVGPERTLREPVVQGPNDAVVHLSYPFALATTHSLTGVTAVATDDVWASGYEGNVDNQNFMKPYVLHWDGSSWTLSLTPNSGGEGSRLNATVALSAGDVWAVGQTQALNGEIFTLTEKFDGTAWTMVPSPSPGGTNGYRVDSLSSVAGLGASGLVAVGAREIAGQCCLRTLALATNAG